MTGVEISPEFAPLMREHGLDSFEKVMESPSSVVMRSVPGRATMRVQIGSVTAYLKRYEPPYYSWWQRLIGQDEEATHEWRMIHVLRARGFKTATPIACGRSGPRSFVITQEIPGGVPADDYLRTLAGPARRAFVEQVAELTKKFHETGFIHRDYYIKHIYVSGTELYLIDLHRVIGPGKFRSRWRTKDLGALAYSAQLAGASHAELMRFYQRYAGTVDKRAIRNIMRRVARLHARGPKYGEIWDRPGESSG